MAASSPSRFAVAQWLVGLFGSLVTALSKDDPWIRLPRLSGWGYSKDFPRPATRSFRSRFQKRNQSSPTAPRQLGLPDESHAVTPIVEKPIPNRINRGIDDFARELEVLGGNFITCSPTEVADKILEILRMRGIDQLLAWESPFLPPGLLDQLSKAGIHLSHPTADTYEANSLIQAGLTGTTAGIADTGSLLLLSGLGRPLTASLLPEIHISILWEKDIFENLKQVLQQVDIKQASAAILVTGPSRTTDIEMTLTIGVHGPGEVHVICIKKVDECN